MPSEETSSPEPEGGPGGQDPGGLAGVRTITDARALRALAHPVRIALIEELMLGGALTATEMGERIGETPTTCSFHLRQLAKYGFVEEAGGGRGRARPWRITSIGMSFAPAGQPDAEVASEAVLGLFRERQFARYHAWRQARMSYPGEWRDAANDSEFICYLTASELEQLSTELNGLLMRWVQHEGRALDPSRRPPGALPVETLLFSYPIPPPDPPASEPR